MQGPLPVPRRISAPAFALASLFMTTLPAAAPLLIDDRSSGDARSALCTSWRLVTDQVMGGVSSARLQFSSAAGRPCLKLVGAVSLENNGGFVQASLDLAPDDQPFDAGHYTGIELDVYGNGESYNLHLRTADTWIVWQSYRASFAAADVLGASGRACGGGQGSPGGYSVAPKLNSERDRSGSEV